MRITTLAKLAALGGAAYYVKKQGGFGPAFDKLKESMRGLADQAKPAVESALDKAGVSGSGSSMKTETGSDVGTNIGGSSRSGSTFGNKTNY